MNELAIVFKNKNTDRNTVLACTDNIINRFKFNKNVTISKNLIILDNNTNSSDAYDLMYRIHIKYKSLKLKIQHFFTKIFTGTTDQIYDR